MEVAAEYEAGKQVAAQSGCLACHKFGENGNDGPGPELTEIGAKLPRAAIARHADRTPRASCRPTPTCRRRSSTRLVDFLASLQGQNED